jgi:hypothetical protein
MFEHECILRPNNQRSIFAKLEYVKWVEKILKLNYGILDIVVLFCTWVKANNNGMNRIIKHDEHMFTLISFSSFILIMNQSFVFPLHRRIIDND